MIIDDALYNRVMASLVAAAEQADLIGDRDEGDDYEAVADELRAATLTSGGDDAQMLTDHRAELERERATAQLITAAVEREPVRGFEENTTGQAVRLRRDDGSLMPVGLHKRRSGPRDAHGTPTTNPAAVRRAPDDDLTDDELRACLTHILWEQGFMRSAIDCTDSREQIRAVTVADAVEAFRGNCWDDHAEGGEHKFDLLLCRKVMLALGWPADEIDSRESIDDLEDHSDW